MKTFIAALVIIAVVAPLALGGVVYSGMYDIGADAPHWRWMEQAIQAARDRSISVRSESIRVPDLSEQKRIDEGAGHYASMCSDCHSAPGAGASEVRAGLYPVPPDLTEHDHAQSGHGSETQGAARQFWIIKHGVKMTGMPAWGRTHDDESIWNLVAFLQTLPNLSADDYAKLTGGGEPGGGEEDQHSHAGRGHKGEHHAAR